MRTRPPLSPYIGFILGLAAFAAASSGCSSAKSHSTSDVDALTDPALETGSLGLALTARGSSGALYRLRNATFDVFRMSDGNGGGPVVSRPPIISPLPGLETGPIPVLALAGNAAGSASTAPPGFGSGGSDAGGSIGVAGAAGTAGAGGSVIIDPFPPVPPPSFPGNDFFETTLSSETDPLSSTLEATIPIGSYQITLFDGWSLEKVVDGEVSTVQASLVGSAFQSFDIQANAETTVVYRFATDGEVVEFGQGRLIVQIQVDERERQSPTARRALIETNLQALSGLSLRDTLDAALTNSGASKTGLGALDAYHAIIDSYSTGALSRDPAAAHCDDEVTNGAPSLNGYSLLCPRRESEQFANLDRWFPIAMVNRLDLAPADGANCGQQRMIFANDSPIGNSRMFMILEAQLPNPNPECGVDACRPIADFWMSLAGVDDPTTRGQMLADAFLRRGVSPFPAFMNSEHLGPDGGQVRTNNFDDFEWTLREFHFQSAPDVLPLPAPVAQAPNGELWNDLSTLPQGKACRQNFLEAMAGLLGDNLNAMSFPVADECKDSESPNDFSRQDYASHLSSGSGAFTGEIQTQLIGTGLTALDIAARARFAGSCMGCHQEAGGSSLGGGLSVPFRGDFVHVSETGVEDCGDGTACFALSETLRDVFIPERLDALSRFVATPAACGGQGGGGSGGSTGAAGSAGDGGSAGSSGTGGSSSTGGGPGTAGTAGVAGAGGGSVGGPVPPIGGEAGSPSAPVPVPSPALPRLTLGGQLVASHAH